MMCLVSVTLFATFGCDKLDVPPIESYSNESKVSPTESYPMKITFTDFLLEETLCQWTDFDNNKVIIINSNEELSNYIVCENNDYSKIDFSKHSLLLTRGGATSGIRHIDVDFLKEATNEYTLKVLIHTYMTTEAPHWLISIITPKIDNEAVITLNVQQIND
jgi:hypothetical protein